MKTFIHVLLLGLLPSACVAATLRRNATLKLNQQHKKIMPQASPGHGPAARHARPKSAENDWKAFQRASYNEMKNAAQPVLVVPVEVPVEVPVPIPVMQVVVVEDGDQEDEPPKLAAPVSSPATALPAASKTELLLDQKCQQEMNAVKINKTLAQKAQICEKSTNYSQQAIAALETADQDVALAAASKAFRQCAGLSASCADHIAPQVVLKLRFSGVAISKDCAKSGQAVQNDDSGSSVACRQNTTSTIATSLQSHDLTAAVHAAQHGLHTCHKVKAPCDFQLAPVLVMQLIQMAQQQQAMSQVFFNGLRAAEALAEQMEEEDEDDEDEMDESEEIAEPPMMKGGEMGEPPMMKAVVLKKNLLNSQKNKKFNNGEKKVVSAAKTASTKTKKPAAASAKVEKNAHRNKKVVSLLGVDNHLRISFKTQALKF